MTLAIVALIIGLILLVWSADRFVIGAAATAHALGMPPLLIGVLVVGFGTSAPEMLVSVLAAMEGSPGIALGNAYGSNIANIGLILGVTALVSPITVKSAIIRQELVIASCAILLSWGLLWFYGVLTSSVALVLLSCFLAFIIWSIIKSKTESINNDELNNEMDDVMQNSNKLSFAMGLFWLIIGLALLIASSRILVWGAVEIAVFLGLSEMMIGLTIVAIGTSLPELASTIAAARKGEHDIAIGNVLGSNIFNTLGVVGIAGLIQPFELPETTVIRDFPVMVVFSLSLFALCWNWGKNRNGRINRIEGTMLLTAYLVYSACLIYSI